MQPEIALPDAPRYLNSTGDPVRLHDRTRFVPPRHATVHDAPAPADRPTSPSHMTSDASSRIVPVRPKTAGTNHQETSSPRPTPVGGGRGLGTSKTTPLAPTSSRGASHREPHQSPTTTETHP